jgi:hypothetical protein
MFHLDFSGDRSALEPQDKEIAKLSFVSLDYVLDYLSFDETKYYFRKIKDNSFFFWQVRTRVILFFILLMLTL